MGRIGRTTTDTSRRDEARLRELDRKVNTAAAGMPQSQIGPAASLYATAAQNLAASTWTPLAFGQALVDTHRGWDPALPARWTVPIDGVYLLAGVTAVPSAIRRVVALYRNGSPILASQGESPAEAGVNVTTSTPAKVVPCAAGDYLEFRLLVTSAAATSFFANNANGTAFDIAWQAPLPPAGA